MSRQQSLRIKIISPESLSDSQIQRMCDLYVPHHHISYEKCEHRIRAGFDRIILYISPNGEIVGFNGIRRRIHKVKGFIRPLKAIYLGQLYIDGTYRGQHPLHSAMLKLMVPDKFLRPWLKPIIWADSITYKPYLLVARCTKEFYPGPDAPTPQAFQNLIQHLGKTYYPDTFDSESGTVIKPANLIKEHVAPIKQAHLRKPYIRYYAEANPGYMQGNGLIMAFPFNWKNTIFITKQLLRFKFRRRLSRSPLSRRLRHMLA